MANGTGRGRYRKKNNDQYSKMELGKKVATETKKNIKEYQKKQKKEIDEILKGL